MRVCVKIINGAENFFEVDPNDSVLTLKHVVEEQLQVPVSQQRLVFKGKSLSDQSSLKECGIQVDSKIHLFLTKKEAPTQKADLYANLKSQVDSYVADSDRFVNVFRKELAAFVNEMSLDDIERYAEFKKLVAN